MARFASSFLVTLIGCAVIHGQNVITNYAPGIDFSKYRTYKWVPIERAGQPNQIVDAEIKQSIDSQLVRKGFTKVDSDEADLLVGYQVAVNRETQWNAYGMGDGFPWAGIRTGTASATSSTIEVGTLVLDMYDPAAKQLVWTGSATKTINLSKDQQKNQRNLDKAMQKLLKNFPPTRK
jgi:hypothetical protein